MIRYAIARLAAVAPVLFGISIVAFFLVRAVEGDTVTALLGTRTDPEAAAALRAKYGLDRPLPVQYGLWLGHVVRGDLGTSTFTGQPVTAAIAERLPVTAELAALAMLLALATGVPLGVVAAYRQGRAGDRAASVAGLVGVSVPGFWLGTMLVLLLSLKLGWLPSGGWVGPLDDPIANLRHMAMPAVAMGTVVAAVVMRVTRAAMLEVLRQDYVRAARAKGLAPRVVLARHALRNAAIPIVTVGGLQAGYLIGGSVVIEQVFSLPGMGRLILQAVESRDYALLQGAILFVGTAFVLINVAVDLSYALLDPRVRDRVEREGAAAR